MIGWMNEVRLLLPHPVKCMLTPLRFVRPSPAGEGMRGRFQVTLCFNGGEVIITSPHETFVDTLAFCSPLSLRRGDEEKASGEW